MAFNFFRWLLGKGQEKPQEATATEFFDLDSEVSIRDLAFMTCVNFTANALSKCEFRTFRHGEEYKGPEYYLWNVGPNQNQNSTEFIHKLIHHLYLYNEALVIPNNNMLYVADSYSREEYALYEDVFRQVTIGTFTFDRTFVSHEVLFFRLHDTNINRIVRQLYGSYSKLITYTMDAYQKSRGVKGVLSLDMQMAGNRSYKERFEKIRNEDFKRFITADNAVLPLYKGMDFQELAHKTYSSDSTRDIRAMVDDITDFTARAFGIPASIVTGNLEDVTSAVNQALTFCVDPLADLIQEEINRKRYGRQEYLAGNYLQIDTASMKHIDILETSSGADKLIASGVCCVNDIRGLYGLPLIPDAWAWKNWMTKNYTTTNDAAEGGENNA